VYVIRSALSRLSLRWSQPFPEIHHHPWVDPYLRQIPVELNG
jgi:hypothetical protein